MQCQQKKDPFERKISICHNTTILITIPKTQDLNLLLRIFIFIC